MSTAPTDDHLAPVGAQVGQQPPDHRQPVTADQRLGFEHRLGDVGRIQFVGGSGGGIQRDRHTFELLLEHEHDGPDRLTLAVRVAHRHQHALAGLVDQVEPGAAEAGNFLDRADVRTGDAGDLRFPGIVTGGHQRHMIGPERQPVLAGGEPVAEIHDGIQLHRPAAPERLQQGAHGRRHRLRLTGVGADHVLVGGMGRHVETAKGKNRNGPATWRFSGRFSKTNRVGNSGPRLTGQDRMAGGGSRARVTAAHRRTWIPAPRAARSPTRRGGLSGLEPCGSGSQRPPP